MFLSNTKYPVENEYQVFLSDNGGGSNAFTSEAHTNYYFFVDPSQLAPAYDRLANFFIAPTFSDHASSDQVDRERLAVDSEHSKNMLNDAWRTRQLYRDLSNPNTSYSHFGTGNKETLQGGDTLRNTLADWWRSHYSVVLRGSHLSRTMASSVHRGLEIDCNGGGVTHSVCIVRATVRRRRT